MSHFTAMKTGFQNIFYLQRALNKLKIPNFKTNQLVKINSLVLPHSVNNNIIFNWNGKVFTLNFDLHYWNRKQSVNHFKTQVTQNYNIEISTGESYKRGFQPIEIKKLFNGSQIISLERWNQNRYF